MLGRKYLASTRKGDGELTLFDIASIKSDWLDVKLFHTRLSYAHWYLGQLIALWPGYKL